MQQRATPAMLLRWHRRPCQRPLGKSTLPAAEPTCSPLQPRHHRSAWDGTDTGASGQGMLQEEGRSGPAAHAMPMLGEWTLTRRCLVPALWLSVCCNSCRLSFAMLLRSTELAPSPCIALPSPACLSAGQRRLMCSCLSFCGADRLSQCTSALLLRGVFAVPPLLCCSYTTSRCPSPCPCIDLSCLPC